MENNITIEQLTKFSSADIDAIRNLASKLGSNYKELTDEDMQEMLDSSNTNILVAREEKEQKIVAMITVFVYRTPYLRKSYLDEFIVDELYRGRGIGSTLFKKALDLARDKGAAYVDFTSSPDKIASNSLYEKLGFKKRNTNVYRFDF
jgi:ribosomal protein S18 acetylase RimI-like enzyme